MMARGEMAGPLSGPIPPQLVGGNEGASVVALTANIISAHARADSELHILRKSYTTCKYIKI